MIEWLIVLTLLYNDGSVENIEVPGAYTTPFACRMQALSRELEERIIEDYSGRGIDYVLRNCIGRPVIYHES